MSDKEVVRIGPFPANRQGKIKFIQALLDAGKDGFVIPEENFNIEAKMNFGSRLSINLHKVKPSIVTEEDKESFLESQIHASEKIGKDDLLWFAQRKGIEIPDSVKVPTAIRKHIKEALETPIEE